MLSSFLSVKKEHVVPASVPKVFNAISELEFPNKPTVTLTPVRSEVEALQQYLIFNTL